MARPTKQKEMKTKPEGAAADAPAPKAVGGPSPLGALIAAVVVGVISSTISAAAVYFLVPMVMTPIIEEKIIIAMGGELPVEEEEVVEEEMPKVGPVIDLDEFTLNLSDPEATRYLRAELSVTITANDENFGKLSGEAAHLWEENFHHHISHYVPAIRDIVITTLTKHTSKELSTNEGKEMVKEEIKEQVNEVFHGDHEVIRVNIENFIIQ